jgi:fimbrial chaperone protein
MRINFLCIFLSVFLFSSSVYAGYFNIKPIWVYLNSNKKVESLHLKNRAKEAVTIQIKTFEWTQDDKGTDVYTPTEEIFYMPRVITLNGEEERTIKIGYDKKPSLVEKTFRIFFEELPKAKIKTDETGMQIALKLGVPIFIAPQKKEGPKGEITNASVLKHRLSFQIINNGKEHFYPKSITVSATDAEGKDVFSDKQQTWYILPGKNRTYTVDIPADKCRIIKTLSIEAELEKAKISKTVSIDNKSCED